MMEMWIMANVLQQERLREAEEERLARLALQARRKQRKLRLPRL